MKQSNKENCEIVGKVLGEIPEKDITIYRVSLYSHYKIMVNFYEFIASTSGYQDCQATYTKLWKSIPYAHKIGDVKGGHDRFAMIDYAATIMITFGSKQRVYMQQWWVDVFDKWVVTTSPNLTHNSTEAVWVTLNGGIAMLGYAPMSVYGGISIGKRNSFLTVRTKIGEECKKVTKWMTIKNSPRDKDKPYDTEVFLFTEPFKDLLKKLCDEWETNHQISDL